MAAAGKGCFFSDEPIPAHEESHLFQRDEHLGMEKCEGGKVE